MRCSTKPSEQWQRRCPFYSIFGPADERIVSIVLMVRVVRDRYTTSLTKRLRISESGKSLATLLTCRGLVIFKTLPMSALWVPQTP